MMSSFGRILRLPTFASALATLTRYWFGVVSQPPG
jgi:hypothetical protein